MRKPLDEMTPDELRRESEYQECHFQNLVKGLDISGPYPKTRFRRCWGACREVVVTIAQIVFWTIVTCGIIVGIVTALIMMVAAVST